MCDTNDLDVVDPKAVDEEMRASSVKRKANFVVRGFRRSADLTTLGADVSIPQVILFVQCIRIQANIFSDAYNRMPRQKCPSIIWTD